MHEFTRIDPWFLTQFAEIVELRRSARRAGLADLSGDLLADLKRAGFGDEELGGALDAPPAAVRDRGREAGLARVYKRIDTCAAEFESFTPYLYGTWERECESDPTDRRKVVILGSGPNRIGQGIEFDYCCCHAAFALKEEGLETVMVNCNPETVSTDYDSVDRLYFEPLTLEDVSAVIEKERTAGGEVACIVQFGGQTPLKLALGLQGGRGSRFSARRRTRSTSPRTASASRRSCGSSAFPRPPAASRRRGTRRGTWAAKIGYPLVVRPSYVLGGRAMAIVYDAGALDRYMTEAVDASPEHPVLIDKFLEDAFELDVDAVADSAGGGGHRRRDGAYRAGGHSLRRQLLRPAAVPRGRAPPRHHPRLHPAGRPGPQRHRPPQRPVRHQGRHRVRARGQPPGVARTVPYLSKATGVPLAKVAARVMAGRTLGELGLVDDLDVAGVFVKAPVFPFVRFPGVDTILGPEMKSTGEVMGAAATFGSAYAKAQLAAGQKLPDRGTAFISVNNEDKANVLPIARDLAGLGFSLLATRGTAAYLRAHGLEPALVYKVNEGRPHIGDRLLNREIDLVINTPLGRESFFDDRTLRRIATVLGVPCVTTLTGASAAVSAIRALKDEAVDVQPLQEYHAAVARS